MGKTSIEWTEATWNPTRGCSRVSEGCRNCYAERQAARFSGTTPNHRRGEFHQHGEDRGKKGTGPYAGFAVWKQSGPSWTGKVELIESKLDEPLHWKKPRRIFVNSMSDLFHEELPDEAIDRVFAVMAMCPQHTFQVLTKRAERMYKYVRGVNSAERFHDINLAARQIVGSTDGAVLPTQRDGMVPGGWPLPAAHLGVSVENRPTKDRMDWLRKTPAAVRFVSLEPCLEDPGELNLEGIHQVIFGGESGPGARPCDLAWARSTRDQCQAAGVNFFCKQLGSRPVITADGLGPHPELLRQLPYPISGKGGKLEEMPADLRIRQNVECNG